MSVAPEYKQQIEPYKWLIIKRIDDLQHLLKSKNKIINEQGLSGIIVYIDDLFNAVMNVYDILPKDVVASIMNVLVNVRKSYTRLNVIYNYEELLTSEEYRIKFMGLLNDFVATVHEFLRTAIDELDKKGLLLRKESVPMGGES